jgi:hypothetical protein
VREGGRIASVAAIIAVAVNTEGKREIVGLHIGPSEAEPFWSSFLKDLARRGLSGVKLLISDAHEGLKAALPGGAAASTSCAMPWAFSLGWTSDSYWPFSPTIFCRKSCVEQSWVAHPLWEIR